MLHQEWYITLDLCSQKQSKPAQSRGSCLFLPILPVTCDKTEVFMGLTRNTSLIKETLSHTSSGCVSDWLEENLCVNHSTSYLKELLSSKTAMHDEVR